ncbi:uncharacterized protein LOC134288445 [Aedes albopictus]|uniref:Peptidase A2 domain-containing protein n=1 Tax=Aedes albopictus TaxID=7160 RepID=A0ABM1YPD1_AEDAL
MAWPMVNPLIPPFVEDAEGSVAIRWEEWKKQINAYVDWRGIEDHEAKFKTLALFGGPDIRRIIDQIDVDENHLIENRYHLAIETLDGYFIPRISIAFELQKFRQASPLPGENIEKFAFRLRKLAENCELGEQSEKLIVNQIMSTTKDLKLKAKILKSDLPLNQVIAAARAHESLQSQLDQCETSATPCPAESVLKINKMNRQSNETLRNYKQERCPRCNGRHAFRSDNFPAKDQKCRICGIVGHFARCCRQIRKHRNSTETTNSNRPSIRKKQYIREIERTDDGAHTMDAEAETFDLFHLDSKKRTATVCIGGAAMKLIIDTGADVDVLCDRDWKTLKETGFMAFSVRKGSKKSFQAYGTSNNLKVLGEVDSEITWKGNTVETTLYVIEGGKCSLMSGDTAEKLGLLKFVQAVDNVAFPHMQGNV